LNRTTVVDQVMEASGLQVEIPRFDAVPSRISRLNELSFNLWWCWNAEARRVFRTLDRTLWQRTSHNPVRMLLEVHPERLQTASVDSSFLELYDRVVATFDAYMSSADTWFNQQYPDRSQNSVAYFCAEFAVHTSVPIYSGGLGLLAGDTCKEASDLGVPFVAVGALYPEGYFRQQVKADGTQEVYYERIQTHLTPLLPVNNDDGSRLLVTVPLDGRDLFVAVWRVQVGRVPIYLIDTDIPENEPWDRDLVARLYGGDNEVRLRQEIVLGIGGVKVLRALGYDPAVIHLNEGHAAFAALELIRESRASGRSFQEALESTRRRLVFTTHTPVKAGHDEFPFFMMEEHFRHYWEEIEVSREEVLGLGTPAGTESFSMTVLALRAARKVNGVSRRHGEVSREMWHFLYPDREVAQVPIVSITNGVHVPTWLSGGMVNLFTRYIGEEWKQSHDDPAIWDAVFRIPDEELWHTHQRLKTKLVNFMRKRARLAWMSHGASPGQIVASGTLLNPEALTIGFARRFATYKRAALILQDPERLRRLLLDPWRPVQIIFAGKPHPADEPGKYLLRRIYEACTSPHFGGRIAFIENYNKQVAHFLVHGVDVWLNNPEPPKEASGTSGQKASLNGVLNLSVLDGWWGEGYNGSNGWVIEGQDDQSAANSLYEILEKEVVPLFYHRDPGGLPRDWIQRMKEAIRSTSAPFSARRMMKQYLREVYFPTDHAG
jgi:glycogen phosphorylase